MLGIEDGRAAVGHAASRGDTLLKHEGVATAFALAQGRSVSFRHVIGAVPLAYAEPPSGIEPGDGRMRLVATDGSARDIAFDSEFLRIGRSVAA